MRVDWLRKKRTERCFSQDELAKECGISQTYYSYIELGQRQPSVKVAKKIAAVLGIEWTKFFEEKEEQNPNGFCSASKVI